MRYFKKIVGQNVYLSPMNIEDYEEYTKWLNDFRVTDCTGASTKITTLESEKLWLENNVKEPKYQFAIIDLKTDKLLGNCGFNDVSHIRRCATLGIFLGDEESRNKGIGTETLKLLLDYGFNYLNLNNIMLHVFSFNERAISVYKKVGFKEFGRRREAYFLNGKYYDVVHMDMLSKDFEGSYIKNKYII